MAYHKKETHFVFAILAIAAVVLIANFFIVAAFQQILTNNAINEAQQAQAFAIFYMFSSLIIIFGILVVLFFLGGMVKFSLKSFAEQMDGKEKK